MSATEPILQENKNRFVIFPIQHHDIWDWYKKSTGNSSASRSDFRDSVDFIGWYTNKTEKILKVSKKDAFKQYLAYHEGWGNFKNYKNNKKVINLAKRVEKQSNIYKQQLSECKNSLSTSKYIIF